MNPFLEDHMIGQEAVLPMVCASAWQARNASLVFAPGKLRAMENIQVFKGLVFGSASEAKQCTQEITRQTTSDDSLCKLKSVVYSSQGGNRVNHYGAELLLADSGLDATPATADSTILEKLTEAESAKRFYQNGTLFHGEGLQLLERYNY